MGDARRRRPLFPWSVLSDQRADIIFSSSATDTSFGGTISHLRDFFSTSQPRRRNTPLSEPSSRDSVDAVMGRPDARIAELPSAANCNWVSSS